VVDYEHLDWRSGGTRGPLITDAGYGQADEHGGSHARPFVLGL
jgi:hypothetical protein